MSISANLITRLQSAIRPFPTITLLRALSTKKATTPTAAAPPQRQKIVLKDEDLIETFVKGSGPGGQCINKRSTCVDLRHIPTGIRVQCQQSRSLADNRGIARKLLREKLDEMINGDLSKSAKKAAKIAKQKARRARRAKQKYSKVAAGAGAGAGAAATEADEATEEEEEFVENTQSDTTTSATAGPTV